MSESQDSKDTTTDKGSPSCVAGKYLTFSLESEKYGVEILKVIEINTMMHITKVPRCAPHVKGVVNLRGKIIPVVDLRMLFGMPKAPYDEQTCTIMISVTKPGAAQIPIGIIVDRVLEVADFESSDIAPAPDYGVNLDSEFILGMGTREQTGVVVLIDIDKVLKIEEVKELSRIAHSEGHGES